MTFSQLEVASEWGSALLGARDPAIGDNFFHSVIAASAPITSAGRKAGDTAGEALAYFGFHVRKRPSPGFVGRGLDFTASMSISACDPKCRLLDLIPVNRWQRHCADDGHLVLAINDALDAPGEERAAGIGIGRRVECRFGVLAERANAGIQYRLRIERQHARGDFPLLAFEPRELRIELTVRLDILAALQPLAGIPSRFPPQLWSVGNFIRTIRQVSAIKASSFSIMKVKYVCSISGTPQIILTAVTVQSSNPTAWLHK